MSLHPSGARRYIRRLNGRVSVAPQVKRASFGRILSKLGLRDRVQAVIFAYETGLVRASER
jgi:hypothetical protein